MKFIVLTSHLTSRVSCLSPWGWSGGAKVLDKLPVPGVLLTWITVGQGPTVLPVGTGGDCLDIFSLVYHFSLLSPSLWETARYGLKYCLKGPLSTKQPTNFLRGFVTQGGNCIRLQQLFTFAKKGC